MLGVTSGQGQVYEHAWPPESSFTYVTREVRPRVWDYSIEILVFYYSIFYKGGWGYLHAWPVKGVLFMLGETSGQGQGYEHAWPQEGSFIYVRREVRPRVWDYSIEILVFYYSIFYKGGWGYLHAWPGKGVLFMLGVTSGQGQGYEHAWPREGSFTYVRREVRSRVWDYSIEILVFYYSIFYKGGWGYLHAWPGKGVLFMLDATSGQGQGYEHAWPREGSFTYVRREVRTRVWDYSIEILVFYYSIFYKGGWGYLHAWPGKGVLFMLGATSGQGQGFEHAFPQEGSFTYVRREVRPRVWDYSIEILIFYSIFYTGGWGYLHARPGN